MKLDTNLCINIISIIILIYTALKCTFDIILSFSLTGVILDKIKYKNHNAPLKAISIILIASKQQEKIIDKIKMLLDINYHKFEIIVVNDTEDQDFTKRLINEFSLEDSNDEITDNLYKEKVYSYYKNDKIKLINKEKSALYANINTALDYVEYEIFCYLDKSLMIEKNALKKISAVFNRHKDTAFVLSSVKDKRFLEIRNNECIKFKINLDNVKLYLFNVKNDLVQKKFCAKMKYPCSFVNSFILFNTEMVKDMGGFDLYIPLAETLMSEKLKDRHWEYTNNAIIYDDGERDIDELMAIKQANLYYLKLIGERENTFYNFLYRIYAINGMFKFIKVLFFVFMSLGWVFDYISTELFVIFLSILIITRMIIDFYTFYISRKVLK